MNAWPPGWAEDDARRPGGHSAGPAGTPGPDPASAPPRAPHGNPISPPGTLPSRPAGTLPAAGGTQPPPYGTQSPPPGLPPDAQPTAVLPPDPGAYPPQPVFDQPGGPVQSPPRPYPEPAGPDGPGGPPGPGGPGGPRTPGKKPNWKKRILVGTVVFLVLVLAFLTGTYFWLDSKIRHQDVLQDYKGRPAATAGTTWLIVGSDSREGMSDADKKKLRTGSAEGKRTDSMMLLHKGAGGTSLISLPRDSWVQIPAYDEGKTHVKAQKNKLNAAFSLGGAPLLVRTVEMATGMRLDHYAEVGFDGFVGIVDSLGGVDMCLDKPIKDEKSGADLPAGCQSLDGGQALSFVRARYFDPSSDLGRMKRQQQFLSALAKKAKSPSVLLNPFKGFPMADASLSAVIVDDDTGLFDLYDLFKDMGTLTGGEGGTVTVPIKDPDYRTSAGSSVLWDDAKAKALFDALRNGNPIPR